MAAVVTAAAALSLIIGTAPARADFHGFCTGSTPPTAYVHMSVSGSTLTYMGLVNCGGTSVAIQSLTFAALDASGQAASSAPPVSCASCTGPLTTSGTYQLPGPGTYSVKMTFTVTSGATTVERFRTERAVWAGSGSVVVVCGGTDQANQQNSCPVP
jgi:hypothetical protein